MGVATLLGATLAVSAAIWGVVGQPALAVTLSDGTVNFVGVPRLEGASTTFNQTYAWGATYYFTISVPEDAGEPLQRIAIAQHEGSDEIEFDLEESRAYEGTRRNPGSEIALLAATPNKDNQTLDLTFSPPVHPGKKVTIALRPVQNPRYGGVYLFGVTAFPPGEKARGQFLGFGRLHFYERGDLGL
ncbi:DUF2808 domain-containing protein [Microseira wollei]|uniref:DUF2808 domain-containing protein n=1 Tax=Microseira wollei NIES-4236 TaxID=2530354 RepID=A0AAV3XJP8_9CYAN|nr:DUF2808 domain-containing protein [Microseira wollei]GET40769.1 hypothetical protein MiSe_55800 [Microseira wollei NIES-4236]